MSDSQTSDNLLGTLKPHAICHKCNSPVSIRWVNGNWELRHHETWSYDEGKKICPGTETPTTLKAIQAWVTSQEDKVAQDEAEVNRVYAANLARIAKNRNSIQVVKDEIRQGGGKRG